MLLLTCQWRTYLEQYPHWQALERDGVPVKRGGLTWMNGFHPEVQQFMQSLIAEIITNYDVDGIQGCDRLPALPVTAGYDAYTKAKYQAACSQAPPHNYQDNNWIQWRADLLTEFLAQMYQGVKRIKPQAIVSLSPAVYPFCLNNLLQDPKTWLDQGLCDIIHPQIYRSDFWRYNQEVKKISQSFKRSVTKFAPGIAFTANGKDVSEGDLIKYIKTNRDR
ncbi:MAG: family 10 glycosylhydrolase, partial [Hydrococcus sp. SU_1_0]|nr:family 10 glycosylhydrolase [Hydrococcus sp. SU_1_0]